jgi:hypothetical protein
VILDLLDIIPLNATNPWRRAMPDPAYLSPSPRIQALDIARHRDGRAIRGVPNLSHQNGKVEGKKKDS